MSSSKILLVEGLDDLHFIEHLCSYAGISPPGILQKQGAPNAIKAILPELSIRYTEVLGVVLDANDDIDGRWSEIVAKFAQEGIELPDSPVEGGCIVDCGKIPGNIYLKRVGVWLMPDNISSGELEDFIAQMIPPEDTAWQKAQKFIDEIQESNGKFPPQKTNKAKVLAWLATRKAPGLIGLAIDEGDLQTNGDLCQSFIRWLNELFAE